METPENFYLDVSGYKPKELDKIKEEIKRIEKDNPFYEMDFIYDGTPKPAPRPRVARWGGMYDPGAKDKKAIGNYVAGLMPKDWNPIEGEIQIYIKCYKPTISAFNKTETYLAELGLLRPHKKPDVDNYAKTILDGLNGIVWEDDGQIVDMEIKKYYSQYPRIEVRLLFRERKVSEK